MKKVLTVLFLLLTIAVAIFAEDEDDLFDDIFENETDIEAPLITEPVKTPVEKLLPKMINFSGNLKADVGFMYTYNTIKEQHLPRGFFDIENHFYINARPANIFSIKADVYTAFEGKFLVELKEFYFDYNPFSFLYITAGKKKINWGYVRLFSDKDFYKPSTNKVQSETSNKYGNEYSGTMYTNVLSDSEDQLSLQLRFPWSTGTATLLALFNMENPALLRKFQSLELKDLSYAVSVEQIFFNTSFNLFMRTYGQLEYTKPGKEESGHKNPTFGFEAKRTIHKTDIYAQELIRINDFSRMNSSSGYERNILSTGFYHIWDTNFGQFIINAEYQWQHDFLNNSEIHLTAVDAAIKKLGPRQNMKVGTIWNQNYSGNSGDISLIFQISKLIPFADIKNVLQIYYKENKLTKFQAGITLYVNCGY